MNPKVKDVKALKNYTLMITFTNNEIRLFDVKPYLDIGKFQELKELCLFNSVKPFMDSIQWTNGLDLCPDTLYLDSQPV